MHIFDELAAYLKTHALNIGTDVVQHLKAFAAHVDTKAKTEAGALKADVQEDVKAVETKVEAEVKTVESALKEIKEHSETAFADLLAAQSKPAQ